MQNPQALPVRATDLSTSDPSALAAVQRERGREYVELAGGAFRGALRERSSGRVGLLFESWSRPVRVRCTRPHAYVAFSVVASDATARWCGLEIAPASVLEIGGDWELTTRGVFASWSLAVVRSDLDAVEAALVGRDPSAKPPVNCQLAIPASDVRVTRLRSRVRAMLSVGSLLPSARRALGDELVHLAVELRRAGGDERGRVESHSRRRAAVRAVEDFLDAHEREVPSLAELCSVARTSERTLEYAFREQIGVTPARYLRVRRLNAVRRELLAAEPGAVRVTDVAMRWGFWELGRFAREYRELFGERPSQTRAVATRRVSGLRAAG